MQSLEIKRQSEMQRAQREQDVSDCFPAPFLLPAVTINAAV